jgi:hypothetical protein
VNALTISQQDVILTFPVINSVGAASTNPSASVDPESGNLSTIISTIFTINTNNSCGIIAEFRALVQSASGNIDGLSGQDVSSDFGKIVLTNINALPTSSSVANALGNSSTPENNPNVITYQIQFSNSTAQNYTPVFNAQNSNTARSRVIDAPGSTEINVTINNNSSYTNGSYSKLYDNAGTYQATIYCTVYSP